MYNQEQTDWITNAILYASSTYSLDPLLLTALLEQESHFNLNAMSGAGAIGIAQLMPGTASMIGVDPYNPLENILGGASYLRTQAGPWISLKWTASCTFIWIIFLSSALHASAISSADGSNPKSNFYRTSRFPFRLSADCRQRLFLHV